MKSLLFSLVLIAITLVVFWQTGTHEFINLDDSGYVTENPHVQAGLNYTSILWAFSATTEANWHPVTWLSHMADCQLFGLNTFWHHLMNVMLHALNAVLLFLTLRHLTGSFWRSAFVAALFALHPLHVESVAWVAERKDLLSSLFWFLTMLAYAAYTKRPAPLRYLLVLTLFSLGLMAKPMLVTLPFVLFLLDYWPLGRWNPIPEDHGTTAQQPRPIPNSRLVLEKVPLILLAATSSTITYLAQQKAGAVQSLTRTPLLLRVENAFIAYVRYLGKTIWPTDLAIIYPMEQYLPFWQVACSVLLLLGITLLVVRLGQRHPYGVVGWFWFLGTLVPVIGIVKVGSQSMADRYTYVPLIGLFIIFAWSAPELLQKFRQKKLIMAAAGTAILATLCMCTWRQLEYWQNNITLYRHSISATQPNTIIHNNLGSALYQQGRLDEAIEQDIASLKIDPNNELAHFNLGLVYSRQGYTGLAINQYSEVVRINPDNIKALTNLGSALAMLGNNKMAMDCFEKAARIDSGNLNILKNLDIIRQKTGR